MPPLSQYKLRKTRTMPISKKQFSCQHTTWHAFSIVGFHEGENTKQAVWLPLSCVAPPMQNKVTPCMSLIINALRWLFLYRFFGVMTAERRPKRSYRVLTLRLFSPFFPTHAHIPHPWRRWLSFTYDFHHLD